MRPRTIVAIGFALTLAVLAAPVFAQDGYDHGRLRYVDPGVTVQRATDTGAEEAQGNEPFMPGDRVWTDASGRAEFQFPDGSSVRLDSRSKLDYSGHDEGRDERVSLRLWSGGVIVHTRGRGTARFEVETPSGMVSALERSVVRVDVDGGEARVSVYDGEAVLDDGQARTRLSSGERTLARMGGRAEEPSRFDADESDDFARWDEEREVEVRVASADARYLPGELQPYSQELERNGDWRYEGGVGAYVWVPQVDAGWQPYSNGRWSWTPYGWTWVPNERWGWAPFHYGRWDYAASLGWYWMPGSTWSPAWVSWAVGGGYVGWCPLGRYDRPVVGWGEHGGGGHGRLGSGNAVPRTIFGNGPRGAWNVVRSGDLGHRNIAQQRLPADRVDPSVVRVGESPTLRPSRDGLVLRPQSAVPRAVSTRMSPGDFVRELGVDNRTTIPAPWTHGYGPPPVGADGARSGVPRDRDPGQRESSHSGAAARGGAATGGSGAGTGASGTAAAGGSGGSASGSNGEATSAAPRGGRPVPWSRPAQDGQRGAGASSDHPAAGNAQPSNDGAAHRRDDSNARATGDDHRSRGEDGSHAYRPRDDGGSGRSEPRSYGGSGTAQPRSNGGGESHASGGSHSSGDGSHSSSGGSQASGGGSQASGGSHPSSGGSKTSGGSSAPREHAAPRPVKKD